MRHPAGFTLIELVIVMLVISVGLLGLTPLFSNTSKSLTTNEDLQRTTQYAQQCAEQVLTTRRESTFASFAIDATSGSACSSTPDVGYTRTAGVGTPYSYNAAGCNGNSPCPCPSGGTNNCKNVTITVAKGATSSSITVMLVDY